MTISRALRKTSGRHARGAAASSPRWKRSTRPTRAFRRT